MDENETKADLLYARDQENKGRRQCTVCCKWYSAYMLSEAGACLYCRCVKCGGDIELIVGDYQRCTNATCGALYIYYKDTNHFIGYPTEVQLLCKLLESTHDGTL